jgi:hypothetical protein
MIYGAGATITITVKGQGVKTWKWQWPEDGLVAVAYEIEPVMIMCPWPMEQVSRDDSRKIAWYRRMPTQGGAV